MVDRPPESPSDRAIGWVARFFGAALFGLLMSVALVVLAHQVQDTEAGGLDDLLIFLAKIMPLVWGVLGIFFFNQMLDIAGKFFSVAMYAWGRRRRRW